MSTQTTSNVIPLKIEFNDQDSIRSCIRLALAEYFNTMDGHATSGLYDLVMQEVEQPLLESVMRYTQGNQTKASEILGINRGTLRKKLKQYHLD
ncbi:MAG: DNA-binding transcriptional regulator Fis [Pseudomonadota bacterium]